jgi:hypothetical protein
MTKGQRSCIFCGNIANSHEHLLPEWLQSILPSDEPAIHYREVGGVKTSWEKKPFTETTRIVCHECNTGWMGRLEEFAKPILTPAVARTELPCQFDLREQWIAAQWAVKTCFVFQSLGPKLLAPSIHPFLLRLNGRPPPQVTVFIGSHHRALKDPPSSVYIQKPLALVSRGNDKSVPDFGYLAFLAVGGVSFLVVGHRFGSYFEVVTSEHTTRMVAKIWPWSAKVLPWPPELLLDEELIVPFFIQDSYPPGLDIRPFPEVISPDDGQGGTVRRRPSRSSEVAP